MNREILFRAKRADNGEWVYGLLTHDCNDNNKDCLSISENWTKFHEVDPSTIGQYTGLNDKNGVKIFEGDIMKWSKNVEVMFGKGMFGARLPSTNYPNSMISLEKLEVVGNRFDNPELTKQS